LLSTGAYGNLMEWLMSSSGQPQTDEEDRPISLRKGFNTLDQIQTMKLLIENDGALDGEER